MKADEVLIAHHDVLRGLLRQLAETTGDQTAERRRLRDDLLRELEVHTQIEDELFYPAVRDVSPLLSVAHAEHRQIDDQLATVMRTSLDDPEFVTEVRMLESTLRHHTFEEEQRMFPQAHALGEERMEELGRQLQERQDELGRSGAMRLIVRLKRMTLKLV
ncbi:MULTISPECIES: hemerythrin domain-containing protein [unclassified Modestobacter]|uniref:hemerythrin domain-containing protein n=1 Tax=unclassified Modestobacter TaxID=2643866 RepID=UPI0022AA8B03|nr:MULTISPECIES: hemerythrin domain-containing protein [unclassified Modestobacter]MCZ2810174.1 hemerythrin domain-containing protein [Modestobacter sp. VKM Ac-2979]MCZ2819386.1 hemerythrin domain-containing protein [Modestobacter sp. VKM Ac-2977]MCZ2841660.1 hemerythrin domain-containing protein [Modestobacter sp. VKM Ac-2980]MCZ2850265.1 hemerythrin domain-containing protein [Modestobacter sp. VKM Ac-2978]